MLDGGSCLIRPGTPSHHADRSASGAVDRRDSTRSSIWRGGHRGWQERHVDHDCVAMRMESRVRSQLSRSDLEAQLHCGPVTVGGDSTLPNICRALGEGSDEGEGRRPGLSHTARRTQPVKVEDVGTRLVAAGTAQRKSTVASAPLLHMRSEMDLGRLGDPARLAECGDQFRATRYELNGSVAAACSVWSCSSTPMAGCSSGRLSYVVVSEGGLAGVGETLRRVCCGPWQGGRCGVRYSLEAKQFEGLEELSRDRWPAR